jgi:hypothetical protein
VQDFFFYSSDHSFLSRYDTDLTPLAHSEHSVHHQRSLTRLHQHSTGTVKMTQQSFKDAQYKKVARQGDVLLNSVQNIDSGPLL